MGKNRTKKITGQLLNFRGMLWAPVNEQGVVFLFGMIASELGLYVELVRSAYPDCIAKKYIGKGRWEEIRIEFEYRSKNFNHDSRECDIIVCWEHNWPKCPSSIEVIELKQEIKKLQNFTPKPPKKLPIPSAHCFRSHLQKANPPTRKLFKELDREIKKIDKSIQRKVSKYRLMYYSPKRSFAAVALRRNFLNVHLFTNGEKIKGVESFPSHNGEKWGRIYITNHDDLNGALEALTLSHNRIKQCIEKQIPTNWFAKAH